MDESELRSRVRSMHELVGSGEREPEHRADADAAFRDHYRRLRDEWDVLPAAAAREVRDAFLALVGDDDWTTSRERLERAMDRLP
jgi:hypothetical protein